MTDQDNLSSILDRILAGDRTKADIEKLRQSLRVDGDVVQLVSQDGKFNTNIGKIEGGTFHIGDVHHGADSETIESIILKALHDTLQLQSQKPLTYLTGADGLGALSDVPELPVKFLPRPDDLEPMKALLLDYSSQTIAVTGKAHKVGVQGMGGIGKSVLAAALARDEAVRQQFSNGVVWIRLGHEKVNPIDEQVKVTRALTNQKQSFVNIQEGKVFLENLLRDLACLLILDDVWHLDQVEAFNVLGDRCRMVITTRDAGIIDTFGAKLYQLDVLSDAQALQLLAQASEQTIEILPVEARFVAGECGNLPLAIAMVGAMAKGKPNLWEGLLKRLRNADLEKIKQQFPGYPYPDLLRAIQVSVNALEPDQQEKYFNFAVFPEDTPVPLIVLQTFWEAEGLDELDIDEILSTLINRSLIRRDDAGCMTLHDLQLDYVRQQVKDLPTLHVRLLSAYKAHCLDGWATGPNDGYFFEHLATHLTQANRSSELRELLLSFNWLQAKLDATNTNTLITDYDFLLKDQVLNLVQDAIRLSADVLFKDTTQLANQLLGRLLGIENSEVQSLLAQAKNYDIKPWLRPSSPSLIPPGQALISTLTGHQASVRRVAVTPNGRWAISGSNDGTLRIWDLVGKEQVRIFKGHTDQVRAIAVTPDGKQVISGSNDRKLKLWDLNSGEEVCTFEGHTDIVRAVAITQDGTRVVSASGDKTLKIWSLSSGKEIRTLKGHSSRVITIAVTPDGRQIVSGADDNTIKLWELDSGIEVCTIACPNRVRSVAITANGNWLVSASEGRRIQVWDLSSKKLLKTLDGHQGLVSTVTLTLDGTQVLSGSEDGSFKLWDLDSGIAVSTFRGHSEGVNSIAVLPDKQRIISASNDKTLRVWSLSNRNLAQTFNRHNEKITAVTILPNTYQLVLAFEDKTLKVWDLHSDEPIRVFKGHTGQIRAVTVLPDGQQIVSASEDKTLRIWDLHSGELIQTFEGHTGWVRAVAALPNGQQIISGSDDCTIKVWDLNCGEAVHTFKGRTGPIHTVTVMPDGKRFISASGAGNLHVWDLDEKVLACTLRGHTDWVRAVAVFPDGETVISASADKTLRIWNLNCEATITTLNGHINEVLAVAVSSDGQRAVSASQDHSLKLWDLADRRVVASYSSDYPLCACTMTLNERNQTVIVAGDESGRLHLLDLVDHNVLSK